MTGKTLTHLFWTHVPFLSRKTKVLREFSFACGEDGDPGLTPEIEGEY